MLRTFDPSIFSGKKRLQTLLLNIENLANMSKYLEKANNLLFFGPARRPNGRVNNFCP
jgi:hypothetical protein